MRAYIGYDAREHVAYEVLRHSILKGAPALEIVPLRHQELRARGLFRRPWLVEASTGQRIDLIDGRPFSTEFSHTRFLVPKLNGFTGWALFIDCDMLCLRDLGELFKACDDRYAVLVAKQEHSPSAATKMDGQVQSRYPRKNWSSVILWNCGHPANRVLDVPFVNSALGSELHQFSWLDEELIGAIDPAWNWIEGVTPESVQPSLVHFTAGGPWFEGGDDVRYGDLWLKGYHEWLARESARIAAKLERRG